MSEKKLSSEDKELLTVSKTLALKLGKKKEAKRIKSKLIKTKIKSIFNFKKNFG